jgi:LPXTG-motif cell wall-anchored protein
VATRSRFACSSLRTGKPVLPSTGNLNAWLAALGVALTAIYGFGVISRPEHCRWRLGPDSSLALVLFALGIAGLFFVRPG